MPMTFKRRRDDVSRVSDAMCSNIWIGKSQHSAAEMV